MFYKVLWAPGEAIEEAKNDGGWLKAAVLALLAAFVIGASAGIISTEWTSLFSLVFIVALASIVVFSSLLEVFMGVFKGEWSCTSALTSVSLAAFVKSVGVFVFSLVLLADLGSRVSVLLGVLTLSFTIIYAFTILIKAGMEIYDVDLLTMMVAIAVIYVAFLGSLYFSVQWLDFSNSLGVGRLV